jgi:hypothetical protein
LVTPHSWRDHISVRQVGNSSLILIYRIGRERGSVAHSHKRHWPSARARPGTNLYFTHRGVLLSLFTSRHRLECWSRVSGEDGNGASDSLHAPRTVEHTPFTLPCSRGAACGLLKLHLKQGNHQRYGLPRRPRRAPNALRVDGLARCFFVAGATWTLANRNGGGESLSPRSMSRIEATRRGPTGNHFTAPAVYVPEAPKPEPTMMWPEALAVRVVATPT